MKKKFLLIALLIAIFLLLICFFTWERLMLTFFGNALGLVFLFALAGFILHRHEEDKQTFPKARKATIMLK